MSIQTLDSDLAYAQLKPLFVGNNTWNGTQLFNGAVTFGSSAIISGGTIEQRNGSGPYGSVLATGEGYYDTTNRLYYLGDGTTSGGNLVGGQTFLHNTSSAPTAGTTVVGAGGAAGSGWNTNSVQYNVAPGNGGNGGTAGSGAAGGAGGSIGGVLIVAKAGNGGAGGNIANSLISVIAGNGGTANNINAGGAGGSLSGTLIAVTLGSGATASGGTGSTQGAGGNLGGLLSFTSGVGGTGVSSGSTGGGSSATALFNFTCGSAGAGGSSSGCQGGIGGGFSSFSVIKASFGAGGIGSTFGTINCPGGNGSSLTGHIISITGSNGGNAITAAGGNAGSIGSLISVTAGAGSNSTSANFGTAGATGGSISTLINVVGGTGGPSGGGAGGGAGGNGGTVNTLLSVIAGSGGSGVSQSSGTPWNGGAGGNTGGFTSNGGNGGSSPGTASGGAGGTGGSINLSGGAASAQFVGGAGGSFNAIGAGSSGSAVGAAAGSITLSGNGTNVGGALTLSNAVNTITTSAPSGSQATLTLPKATGIIPLMGITTYTPIGVTQIIDLSLGNYFVLNSGSATGTVAITFANAFAGANCVIEVVQGSTAQNCTFPANTIQAGGGGVTYIASGANNTDLIALTCKDSTHARIAVTYQYS